MIDIMKTIRSKKKKQNQYLIGGISLALVFILALSIIHIMINSKRANNILLRRLDTAYSSLSDVFGSVNRSQKRISEKSLGKSCGQSSAIGGGVITCGPYMDLTQDVDSVAQFNSFVESILTSISEEGFGDINKASGASALEGIPVITAKFTHSSTSVPCTFSAGLYDQGQYRKRFGKEPPKLEQPSTKYAVAHIGCDEPTNNFLPGYPVEK